MAYPSHHRGRHCWQPQIVDETRRHRRSRSCPCSTCRIGHRSGIVAASSSKNMTGRPTKDQPMSSPVANKTNASNKPNHLGQIHPRGASPAYLPSYHDTATNNSCFLPEREKESPMKSTASLERDYPPTAPSPTRIIMISSTNHDGEDDENHVENRAYTYEKREYDLATWRMYDRIMESRRHQENLPILSPLVVAQIKEQATATYLKPLCPPLSTWDNTTDNFEISSRDERAQFTTRHLVDLLDRAHRVLGGGGSGEKCHPSAASPSPLEQGVFAMDI